MAFHLAWIQTGGCLFELLTETADELDHDDLWEVEDGQRMAAVVQHHSTNHKEVRAALAIADDCSNGVALMTALEAAMAVVPAIIDFDHMPAEGWGVDALMEIRKAFDILLVMRHYSGGKMMLEQWWRSGIAGVNERLKRAVNMLGFNLIPEKPPDELYKAIVYEVHHNTQQGAGRHPIDLGWSGE